MTFKAEMSEGFVADMSLLSILAIWKDDDILIKHYYSCISSDIKEDAFHACSYLKVILKQVNQIVFLI